jgi:hypothetical protein
MVSGVDAAASTSTERSGRGLGLRAVGDGATAGSLATLGFLILHAIIISDIWFSAPMMLVAGAACGACLSWSHASVFAPGTTSTWVIWNAAQTGLLLLLGLVSLLVFSPQWSMAELMVAEPPLGELFGQALPLMAAFTMTGSIALWAVFSRRTSALPSVVATVALLVLLLGHNAAIIGLVDIPAGGYNLVAEMLGLIIVLGVAFTSIALLLPGSSLRSTRRSS